MYASNNYWTKKSLKEAVARGERVTLWSPGIGFPKANGAEYVEGPHWPEPHRWYAQVEVRDGIIVKVK